MEHGIKGRQCYAQKHIAPRTICYTFPLVRCKPLGVGAHLVKLVYSLTSLVSAMMSQITDSSNCFIRQFFGQNSKENTLTSHHWPFVS